MEGDVGVERDEEVEEGAAQERDGVAAHRQQQQREGEGHGGGRAPRHGDAVAHHLPQAAVLSLHRVHWNNRRGNSQHATLTSLYTLSPLSLSLSVSLSVSLSLFLSLSLYIYIYTLSKSLYIYIYTLYI